jgi:hypothetical protein
MQVLALGTAADPGERPSLAELADILVEIRSKPGTTASEALEAERPAQTWAEEAVVQVDGHHYRVLGRLGTGGTGQTFKVEQFEPTTGEGVWDLCRQSSF